MLIIDSRSLCSLSSSILQLFSMLKPLSQNFVSPVARALSYGTKLTSDAADDDKPSVRSVRQRLSQLRSQAKVLDFSTGWKNIKAEIVPGAKVGAGIRSAPNTTPTRRPSAAVKSTSGRSVSASSPVTPTTTNGSVTPATPFTTSKFKSALPTVDGEAVAGAVDTASNDHSTSTGACEVIGGSTFKHLTSNNSNGKVKGSSNGKSKDKKRKANKISKSDDESIAPDTDNDTSEDEFSTPTKPGVNTTSNNLSLISDRRPSLPRRSKSATPAVYATLDEDDGTGLDDAAKDVSSSEEYDVNKDKGGKKMTPNGKRIGWRDRVGDEEEEED